ncbi:ankyrin repeat domain-containing protein [Thiotrichales bacterium 19S9-12]|nr:ankyrin repeat domain-containing protein [Thiotrichales bacterium 19S9-11]MCF6812353.1 ankyrin repeat domain-containing protein [Thiotrichales bacterium 19S9-12]
MDEQLAQKCEQLNKDLEVACINKDYRAIKALIGDIGNKNNVLMLDMLTYAALKNRYIILQAILKPEFKIGFKFKNTAFTHPSLLHLGDLSNRLLIDITKEHDYVETTKILQNILDQRLLNAIKDKTLFFVTHCINDGADVNAIVFGEDILTYAINREDISIVEELLLKGSKASSDHLKLAIELGNIKIVKLLISQVSVNTQLNSEQQTPLHLAAKHLHEDIVQLLLDNDAIVDVKDAFQKTPLYYTGTHHRMANTLVKADADYENILTDEQRKNRDKIQSQLNSLLLEQHEKEGLLHLYYKDILPLSTILDKNIALLRHALVLTDHNPVIVKLKDMGLNHAITQLFYLDFITYKQFIFRFNTPEIYQLLKSERLSISDVIELDDEKFLSKLDYLRKEAQRKLNDALLELFLPENRIKINKSEKKQWLDNVKDLISQGAELEITDELGHTPLFLAVIENNIETVEYLLAKGANIDCLNHFGESPFLWAIDAGNKEIARRLLHAGASIKIADIKDANIRSLVQKFLNKELLAAVQNSNSSYVKKLITAGANTAIRDTADRTLHEIVKDDDISKLLRIREFTDPISLDDECDLDADNVVFYAIKINSDEYNVYALSDSENLNKLSNCPITRKEVYYRLSHGDFRELERYFPGKQTIKDSNFLLHVKKSADKHQAIINDVFLENKLQPFDQNKVDHFAYAAFKGDYQKVKSYLSKGYSANWTNQKKVTPLLYAVLEGHIEVAKLLLHFGANPFIKYDGTSPFEVAKIMKHEEVINTIQENLNNKLLTAAKRNELELVKRLLMAGASIAVRDADGQTLSQIAEANSYKEITELLRNELKILLFNAVSRQDKVEIDNLLKLGADIKVDDRCYSLLLIAAQNALISKDYKFITFLLEKGIDINNRSIFGETVLSMAVRWNDVSLASFLYYNGADLKNRNIDGMTILDLAKANDNQHLIEGIQKRLNKMLWKAVNNRNSEEVRQLLFAGANANFTKHGVSVLHIFAARGDEKTMEILLEKGALINVQCDFYKSTPLHCAIQYGNQSVTKMLLDHGASLSIKDSLNETPAQKVRVNDIEKAALLEEKQKELNGKLLLKIRSKKGAQEERLEKIIKLLFLGARLEVVDDLGHTPLFLSVIENDIETFEYLLGQGANVNCLNYFKETPLVWAVEVGSKKLVDILINNGADIRVKNLKGESLIDIAKHQYENVGNDSSYQEIIDLLKELQKGSNVLFLGAVHEGNTELVKKFIELEEANVNYTTKEGVTPLTLAIYYNHIEVVKALLEGDADLNLIRNSVTPLAFAKELGREKIVKILEEKQKELNSSDPREETLGVQVIVSQSNKNTNSQNTQNHQAPSMPFIVEDTNGKPGTYAYSSPPPSL